MEFITDFISNNAVLLIAFVTVIAFIAKLIIGYVSKDKTVIIPASELIDEAKERIIDRIEDIEAEEKAKNLLNPVVKEGFNIIKQPSNPNRDTDNSEDSSSDDDEEFPYHRGGKVKDSCFVELAVKTYVGNDGYIRDGEGNIVGKVRMLDNDSISYGDAIEITTKESSK